MERKKHTENSTMNTVANKGSNKILGLKCSIKLSEAVFVKRKNM